MDIKVNDGCREVPTGVPFIMAMKGMSVGITVNMGRAGGNNLIWAEHPTATTKMG
jgi:hypothetical protein